MQENTSGCFFSEHSLFAPKLYIPWSDFYKIWHGRESQVHTSRQILLLWL